MGFDDVPSNGLAAAIPREHVVFTDLDGVEGVLVDLNTRKYYQLNETATLVWCGLEKRKTVANIAAEMTELYDVSPARALSSVESLLGRLYKEKLVQPG
jgi:hypothetical protein